MDFHLRSRGSGCSGHIASLLQCVSDSRWCDFIGSNCDAFSFQVMLALIPVRAPLSKMAHTALLELQQARDLFDQAVPYGGRAVKMAVRVSEI
jgi:hypothetical protein